MVKHYDNGKKVLLIIAVFFVVFIAFLAGLSFAFLGFEAPSFDKRLALISLKGPIFMDSDGVSGTFGALKIVEKIEEAENDPSVAAIFFDIDSPGGEIVATHQIVEKIREVKKPTVSYIGSVGASGAYYVAAATDHVFADPFAVTGSIGAVWMLPNVKELLDEFGVKFGIIRSGNLKALPNPFEELDEEQKKIVEEMVQESFLQFKADILSFREGKISLAELEKISDGRILSGKEALKLHLVDGLLSRDKAILRAGEIMGVLGKPSIKEYSPKGISLFDLLAASGRAFASGFKSSFDFSTAPSFQS